MESITAFNDHLQDHALLKAFYRVTGIPPIATVAVSALIITAFAIVLYSLENICLFLAFSYPAFKSFESIQSDDLKEQRYWLSYWVVYGSLHFIHQITDRLFYRLPYYSEFKMIFLLWCFIPPFRGSRYIYAKTIRPIFVLHRDRIDRLLRKVQTHVDDAHKTLRSASSSLMPTLASGITSIAVQALTKIEERQKKD